MAITPRLLIIGFSNVATTSGFSLPLIARLQAANPDLRAFRVGLGALQPQVIPPYLRLAADHLGPFTHVLLEINASAYALHPLSTVENGRELLADILLTVQDLGAEAAFMLHLRRWQGQVHLDFNALVRRFCAELELPLIDLADGWIARRGAEQVAAWLRDDVHTTAEGGAAMAEDLAPFLQDWLARPPALAGRRLPRPQWRRGVLDTGWALADWPRERHDCADLPLDYARLEARAATLDLGGVVRAQGLVYLFHAAGGRLTVTPDPPGEGQRLTAVDPFSHFARIGVLPFDFYRGRDLRRLAITAPEPADDVTLLKPAPRRPLRTLIGPILTLAPAGEERNGATHQR